MYVAYPIVNQYLSKGFAGEGDSISNSDEKAKEYDMSNIDDKRSWAAPSSPSELESYDHASGCSLSDSSISDSDKNENQYSKPTHMTANGVSSQNSDASHCNHDDDDAYVFTAFASPGCHQIIIYDPQS